MISGLIFYMFSLVLIASAMAVVFTRNTVHGVLWLIFAFFNTAGLFVLLGAEFLAMMLLIVYVGAVAVLFLFVVMMLDVSVVKNRTDWMRYFPFGSAIAGIMVLEMAVVFWGSSQDTLAQEFIKNPVPEGVSNAQAIGLLLYTDYVYLFQISGLILLVAMIGAITLTLRRRSGVHRQDINRQRDMDISEVVTLEQPKSGEGVNV